jgi:AmpD protein
MVMDFLVNKASGLISPAEYILSPNCDLRPENINLDLIVIHSISLPPAIYGGNYIKDLFTNQLDCTKDPYFLEIKDLQVSAHLLISRQGQVTQFVPFNLRAWHAGKSEHKGREACNDFSIGIELEGTDEDIFEDIQYKQLVKAINALRSAYLSLVDADIMGHCDIAPGRKKDPGAGFDWKYFLSLLD